MLALEAGITARRLDRQIVGRLQTDAARHRHGFTADRYLDEALNRLNEDGERHTGNTNDVVKWIADGHIAGLLGVIGADRPVEEAVIIRQ